MADLWVKFLKELDQPKKLAGQTNAGPIRQTFGRTISTPVMVNRETEHQPLLRRRSYDEYETRGDEDAETKASVGGGTVLGIHNLAIVLPQFIVRHPLVFCQVYM
jgi:solute carrier family 45, member 1/2/4